MGVGLPWVLKVSGVTFLVLGWVFRVQSWKMFSRFKQIWEVEMLVVG